MTNVTNMTKKLFEVFNRAIFLAVFPLMQIIYSALNVNRPCMHNLGSALDDAVPFVKEFIVIYLFWYVFQASILVYFLLKDDNSFFRLFFSMVSGMFVCYIIFCFYPTTVPRPDVPGSDLMSVLVRFIYNYDNPYNCFPSIHVLNAMLPAMFFCRYRRKGTALKILAIAGCVLISASTLFVKQHYALDIVSAALLASALYVLFTNDGVWNKVPVRRIINYLKPFKTKTRSMDF